MVKTIALASAAAAAGALLLISSPAPAAAFLPPTMCPPGSRVAPRKANAVRMMVSPADLQASLLGRFRRGLGGNADADTVTRKDSSGSDRPVAKGGPAPPSSSKTAVEELKDVGQRLSRFTAAVLEEESKGELSSITAVSGGSIQGSTTTLKGLPGDFLTKPLSADEATVRGASAVVGGVVGLAVGGPLLALLGAAWTSYSCTQEKSDAGEAARGTGKWAIGFYNFFAKMNTKYTLTTKLSSSLGGLYARFKREVVPTDTAKAVDTVESTLQGAIDVTTKLADDFKVPELIGTALVKTGELSVSAAKALVEYNRQNQVTDKLVAWLRKELLKEK